LVADRAHADAERIESMIPQSLPRGLDPVWEPVFGKKIMRQQ
jgi:hypothetical protein